MRTKGQLHGAPLENPASSSVHHSPPLAVPQVSGERGGSAALVEKFAASLWVPGRRYQGPALGE